MRGTTRSLSLRRRLIADLVHASRGVPFITLRRTLALGPLLDARAGVSQPPGFAAIFAKAFALAAQHEPALRTLYLKWPWPRLFEMPCSVGLIAIARTDDDGHSVLFQKVAHLETRTLGETDHEIRHAKTAAADDIPLARKLLRISALPLPIRRLFWAVGLNSGRQRANYAGSFGVTSVSALGPGELHPLSPGPYLISYGVATADRTIDMVLRWDHRVADGALMALTLARLETILNTRIAAELAAMPGTANVDRMGHSA